MIDILVVFERFTSEGITTEPLRRTEEDALAHIQRLIGPDPKVTKKHIILDNLNIHQPEPLVRWIAEREGIAEDSLGVKGKSGLLHRMFLLKERIGYDALI
jgi:hypothetical protein